MFLGIRIFWAKMQKKACGAKMDTNWLFFVENVAEV